jgi:SAM-dependent methyltransferase
LRPAPEDLAIYGREIRRWHEATRPVPLHALLLGVTPELAAMPWPAGTQLLAADLSRPMIRGVWPGLGHMAVCATWLALPLADCTQDLVLGDGSLSAITGDAYAAMSRSLRRVVRPRGLVLMRFYTRPDRPEAPASAFADLRAGRIGSFHAFKWRLAMALHGSLDAGVRLRDIWDAWRDAVPHPEELARDRGWPLPVVLTMGDFRGIDTRYTFPTLAEARAVMAAGFEEVACHFPAYELGERCPILAFRPR